MKNFRLPFSSPFIFLSLASLFLAAGCSEEAPGCEQQREGNFAIDFYMSGDCNVTGHVTRREDSVQQDLECIEQSNGRCRCRGGDSFGTYDIYLLSDGVAETASIEVSSAPPPECVTRTTLAPFMLESGDGGAGGAG